MSGAHPASVRSETDHCSSGIIAPKIGASKITPQTTSFPGFEVSAVVQGPRNTSVELFSPTARVREDLRAKRIPSILLRKPNAASVAWNFFLVEGDESGKLINKQIAYCSICFASLKSGDGNTSGLLKHIWSKHPEEYAVLLQQKETCFKASAGFGSAKKVEDSELHSSGAMELQADETPANLVQVLNQQSLVWRYFLVEGDDNNKPVNKHVTYCSICSKRVKTQGGNTSVMRNHLKCKHNEEFCQLLEQEQSKKDLIKSFEPSGSWSVSDEECITNAEREWKPELADPHSRHTYKDSLKSARVEKHLVQNPRGTSFVWRFFLLEGSCTGEVLSDQNLAYCSLCQSGCPYTGGSTSTLRKHLHMHHRSEYLTLLDMEQVEKGRVFSKKDQDILRSAGIVQESSVYASSNNSLANANTCEPKVKKSRRNDIAHRSPQEETFDRDLFLSAIVKCCAKGSIASQFIASSFFQELLASAGANAAALSLLESVDELLKTKAVDLKFKLLSIFEKSNNLSIVASFTEPNSQKFLKLSLSVELGNREFFPFVHIETLPLPLELTKESLQHSINCALKLWSINKSNLVAATVDLDVLNFWNCEEGNTVVIPCFASVCARAIEAVLKCDVFKEPIIRALEVYSRLHNTLSWNVHLREQLLPVLQEPSWRCDNMCNWYAVYSIMSHLVAKANNLPAALTALSLSELVPSSTEIKAWSQLVSLLQPVAELATTVHSKDVLFASAVLPLTHSVTDFMFLPSSTDNEQLANLKGQLVKTFRDSYSSVPVRNFLLTCTYLDPRFRTALVPGLDGIRENVARLTSNQDVTPSDPKTTLESKFLSALRGVLSPVVRGLEQGSEIARYESAPQCILDDSPLNWWESHGHLLPRLALLAHKYLSVSGTSLPPSEAFQVNPEATCLLPRDSRVEFLLQSAALA